MTHLRLGNGYVAPDPGSKRSQKRAEKLARQQAGHARAANTGPSLQNDIAQQAACSGEVFFASAGASRKAPAPSVENATMMTARPSCDRWCLLVWLFVGVVVVCYLVLIKVASVRWQAPPTRSHAC